MVFAIVLFWLNVFLQISEGFVWNSSSKVSPACEKNSIYITWMYTLDSLESVLTKEWKKDNGSYGQKDIADFFVGTFTAYGDYIGRATPLGNAGLEILNATSSDDGRYYVIVTLNTGLKHNTSATVSILGTPDISCKPQRANGSGGNTLRYKIPVECPVKGGIEAKWDDGSIGELMCPKDIESKRHKCCARGDPVTKCYIGNQDDLCIDDQCDGNHLLYLLFLLIILPIILLICILWKKRCCGRCVAPGREKKDPVGIDVIIKFPVSESVNSSVDWIGPQGKPLTNSEKYTIVLHDTTTAESSLTIKNVSSDDSGSYTCRKKKGSEIPSKASITITAHDSVGNDMTIKFPVSGYEDSSVDWIGPQGTPLNNSGNSKAGETSFTIKNVSKTGRGTYSCRAKNGSGTVVLVSIIITAHDKDKSRRGNSPAVSRTDVELQNVEGVKSNDEKRLSVVRSGTKNKVVSKTTSMLTKPFDLNERRPLPAIVRELEDKPNHGSHPQLPQNSDVKDRNVRGLSANYNDKRGLSTETPHSSRLTPLLAPIQPTVEEEVASEEPRKKKKKKKKKDQMNERNPEKEMAQ